MLINRQGAEPAIGGIAAAAAEDTSKGERAALIASSKTMA
jgi:hypothetical protein